MRRFGWRRNGGSVCNVWAASNRLTVMMMVVMVVVVMVVQLVLLLVVAVKVELGVVLLAYQRLHLKVVVVVVVAVSDSCKLVGGCFCRMGYLFVRLHEKKTQFFAGRGVPLSLHLFCYGLTHQTAGLANASAAAAK